MAHINVSECEAVAADPKAVEKLTKRLERIVQDLDNLGLTIFGGAGGISLRAYDAIGPIILAYIGGKNIDGGAGDATPGTDGLLRGE